MYFVGQDENKKFELAQLVENSQSIKMRLDQLKTTISEKQMTIVNHDIPEKLQYLASSIEALQRRQSSKLIPIFLLSFAVLVAAIVLSVAFVFIQ